MPARSRHRLGAHMSIAGGLHRAVERARSVDATALQVFVKSSRQWKAKPVDPDEAHVGFGETQDLRRLPHGDVALLGDVGGEAVATSRRNGVSGLHLLHCDGHGVEVGRRATAGENPGSASPEAHELVQPTDGQPFHFRGGGGRSPGGDRLVQRRGHGVGEHPQGVGGGAHVAEEPRVAVPPARARARVEKESRSFMGLDRLGGGRWGPRG